MSESTGKTGQLTCGDCPYTYPNISVPYPDHVFCIVQGCNQNKNSNRCWAGERLEELQAENQRLREALEPIAHTACQSAYSDYRLVHTSWIDKAIKAIGGGS